MVGPRSQGTILVGKVSEIRGLLPPNIYLQEWARGTRGKGRERRGKGLVRGSKGADPGFHRWAGPAWARAELLSAVLQGPGLSSAGAWLKPLKSELVTPGPLQSNICVCVGTFVSGSSVAKSALMVAGEDEEIGKKGFFKKPISVAALCNSALRSTGCPAWLPPREITYLAGNNKEGKAVPSVLRGYVLKSVNLNL